MLLAQLSDPHLFADRDNVFLGINPHDSLNAVINELQGVPQLEAVLATGDLTQDHNDDSYHLFASMMDRLAVPTYVLPGNHDAPHIMNSLLTGPKVSCGRRLLFKNWQVLMLDSTIVGKPAGRLGMDEIAWLTEMLSRHNQNHTLVALHHHPIATGCTWLDEHSLENGMELLSLLSGYDHVKGVIWGHVHQEMDRAYHNLRLMAVPSTSIQFQPNSHNFMLDTLQPGYRLLHLHPDGSIDTEVKRLSCGKFIPDNSAAGY